MTWTHPLPLAYAMLVVLPVTALTVAGSPLALQQDRLFRESWDLPGPLSASTAVWTGKEVLLFGGDQGRVRTDEVISVDPATGEGRVLGHLPTPRWGLSAVWTGKEAYLFGGDSDGAAVADIVRVAGGRIELMPTRLPTRMAWTAAVWDPRPTQACPEGCAYIFGGNDNSRGKDSIIRFDPVSGTASALSTRLPSPRWGMAAAWSGTQAYLVGGFDGRPMADVLAFDPKDMTLEAAGRLPLVLSDAAVAWHSGRLHVFGGYLAVWQSDARVQVFDPGTGLWDTLCPFLEPSRAKAAAVALDDDILVLGGDSNNARILSDAWRYVPVQESRVPGCFPSKVAVPGAAAVAVRDLAAAGATVRAEIPQVAAVTFTCGSTACPVNREVRITSEPKALREVPQSLPEVPGDVPPVFVEATERSFQDGDPLDRGLPDGLVGQGIQSVRIEVELDRTGLAAEDATLYYYNGAGWLDLLAAKGTTVAGHGATEDLVVLDAGVRNGQAYAVVSHASLFALGSRASDHDTIAVGWIALAGGATLAVAGMAVAFLLWRRRS